MKNLAQSVVAALAFLELSSDDVVDAEAAAQVKEEIASYLRQATPGEKEAIRNAVQDAFNTANEAEDPEEVLDFYETFLDSFVEDEEEE